MDFVLKEWNGDARAYLDGLRASSRKPASVSEIEASFAAIDRGEKRKPEPHGWVAPTWEEHKRLVLERASHRAGHAARADELRAMPFDTFVEQMPGMSCGRPCLEDEVSDAEHKIGTPFSDDYRKYLLACGSASVCGVVLTGIGGSEGIVADTLACRKSLGLPERYYPICEVESERSSAWLYVQDADGFVYHILESGEMHPVYASLQELVVGLWYMTQEGLL